MIEIGHTRRPRIALKSTAFDKAMEVVALLFLIILWVVTVFSYYNLPDVIPIHFNMQGQVDKYGDKISLIF